MTDKKIYQKLIEAQKEFTSVVQANEASLGKGAGYKYADISAILKVIRPVLNNHGLAVIQKTTAEAQTVSVETILYDDAGESISSGPFTVSTAGLQQRGVQAFGSAVTYARRYSLVSFLAVAYGENDDDGKAAVEAAEKSAAELQADAKRRASAERRAAMKKPAPPADPEEFVLTQAMVDEAKTIAQQGPESYKAYFTSLPAAQQAALRSSGWHKSCYEISLACAPEPEVVDPE